MLLILPANFLFFRTPDSVSYTSELLHYAWPVSSTTVVVVVVVFLSTSVLL